MNVNEVTGSKRIRVKSCFKCPAVNISLLVPGWCETESSEKVSAYIEKRHHQAAPKGVGREGRIISLFNTSVLTAAWFLCWSKKKKKTSKIPLELMKVPQLQPNDTELVLETRLFLW